MTRRDFELIAKGVREAPMEMLFDNAGGVNGPSIISNPAASYGRWARATVAESLADILHNDNPRFDRRRFVRACLGTD